MGEPVTKLTPHDPALVEASAAAGEQEVAVSRPVGMAVTLQLDVGRAGQMLREISAVLDGDQRVARAVQDQRRALDGCEHVPHVEVEDHPLRGEGHPRARREPLEPPGPLPELVVVGQLGREHRQDGRSTPRVRHEIPHRRAQLG